MRSRIITAVLTAAVLVSLPISGAASESAAIPEGWRQTTFSEIDLSEGYFIVTDSDAHDGKCALKLNNRSFTNNDNKSVFLRSNSVSGCAPGRYEFSFYIKTDGVPYIIAEFDGTGKKINFEGWNINPAAYGFSKTEAENGWTRVEAEFETTAAMTGFCFRLFGLADGILLDDVSLVIDGSEENLIENGSFECASSAADELYLPKNVITSANKQKNMLGISWINPKSAELQRVTLENMTDGAEILQNLHNGFGETNNIEIEIPQNRDRYMFKISFGFSDRESTAYYVSGSMTDENAACGAWTAAKKTGSENTLPVYAAFDSIQRVSGNNSLKIISNIDGEKPSHYMDLRAPIKLTAGKTYKIRAYVRAESVKKISLAVDWDRIMNFVNVDFDWKLFEAEYKNTSKTDTYIRIIADDGAVGFWTDKIEVYETENGEISGSNLFLYGDFEDYAKDKTSTVGATAKALDGGAEISWLCTAADGDIENIFVTAADGENTAAVARMYKNDTKLKFDGLENGREYAFSVYAENAAGMRSEVSEVMCMPKTKKELLPYGKDTEDEKAVFANKNFQKLGGGLTVENPYMTETESGKIASCVFVKNNTDEEMEICMLSVVYKNGNLFSAAQLKKKILPTAKNMPGEELRLISDIPQNTDDCFTVKTMIWDSPINMKPLDAAAELKNAEKTANGGNYE